MVLTTDTPVYLGVRSQVEQIIAHYQQPAMQALLAPSALLAEPVDNWAAFTLPGNLGEVLTKFAASLFGLLNQLPNATPEQRRALVEQAATDFYDNVLNQVISTMITSSIPLGGLLFKTIISPFFKKFFVQFVVGIYDALAKVLASGLGGFFSGNSGGAGAGTGVPTGGGGGAAQPPVATPPGWVPY